jgi:OmpR-family two-component system manganese-sensing sensor histidine kinase
MRLFTNLLGNSLQYTLPGGEVMIHLTAGRLHNQPAVQITVRDTGMGIPEEAIPRLFERFYRVDPARQRTGVAGSGLGLAIAKVIVENHRGNIQIHSVVNEGTTVTILLPLTTDPMTQKR